MPALAVLGVALLAACGQPDSANAPGAPDVVFTMERGALARHLRGERGPLLPAEIEMVAGQSIVILNHDQALHYFLDTSLRPGESLRKTFDEPGYYRYSGAFTCSTGTGSTLTIHVVEPGASSP
jgi:hypothetical protein